MTPSNIEKWLEFEEFAKERDIELRMNSYCFPPVRRGECKEFERLSAERAGELAVQDILYREGQEAIDKRQQNLPQQYDSCKLDIGDPMQCSAGRSQFWINWNGSMVPCGMLENPIANPFEVSFLEAWEHIKTETKKVRLCSECVACPERQTCMNCAAVTYTETGRFDGKPEYMCRMNQAYREAIDKYSTK
jgi:MoaA/NifB/PqqE/SkfB family radical SAM enzyme